MKLLRAQIDMLESMGFGYFELDLRGKLIEGNQIFFNSIGYTRDEMIGKHFRRYVDRKQVSLTFNIFAMIHKTGMVEKKLLLDFIHKDGSPRTAEGSVALTRDENNTPVGFLGILTEITERKHKETTLVEAKRKAERELEIAREIQNSFLVEDYPQPDGWEIATLIRPARQVSGDFYDVFPISANNRIAFLIADVCDKGVGAALYMAIFRSLLRAYADQNYTMRWVGTPEYLQEERPSGVFRRDALLASGAPSIKNAIELTNKYIATHHSDSNMFATVFFGLLDPSNGMVLYINAGHESPLLISNGTIKARLDPTGPAVGMLPDMEFNLEQTALNPGDALILYTDGVTDALNGENEQFNEERLIASAVKSSDSAHSRLQDIVSAVDTHIAGREQYDDITLLAVHRKG
ncbi:MAG TPA: SpoIIE family protein phosphatase [Anaerolineales bacterium]|nr:SpoIIE family protein phosphatase [Anaerolineales bacterium]